MSGPGASKTLTTALRGVRDGAPFLLIAAPFAMLFGLVGEEAGLNLAEIMAFSILVIGGAAQFAAVQLMVENAAGLLALTAALTVNLRMAMYSAALAAHLGQAPLWQRLLIAYLNFDQSFAIATAKYEAEPDLTIREKVGYFLGVAIPTGLTWWVFTLVGAVAGNAIPESYPIDFAVPIAFLAILAPGLRTVAHVVAAFVSVVLALALAWMPSGLGLIVAALAAMAAGAEVERRLAGA